MFQICCTEIINTSKIEKRRLKAAFQMIRSYYGCLFSGMLFSILLNQMLKTFVAAPRPHFLDTCRPKSLNCSEHGRYAMHFLTASDARGTQNSLISYFYNHRFIPYHQIECTQENIAIDGIPKPLSDIMKSFPSGHAQSSTHCAIFMMVSVIKTSYFGCQEIVSTSIFYVALHSITNWHQFFIAVETLLTDVIFHFCPRLFNFKIHR